MVLFLLAADKHILNVLKSVKPVHQPDFVLHASPLINWILRFFVSRMSIMVFCSLLLLLLPASLGIES